MRTAVVVLGVLMPFVYALGYWAGETITDHRWRNHLTRRCSTLTTTGGFGGPEGGTWIPLRGALRGPTPHLRARRPSERDAGPLTGVPGVGVRPGPYEED